MIEAVDTSKLSLCVSSAGQSLSSFFIIQMKYIWPQDNICKVFDLERHSATDWASIAYLV